MCDRFELGSVVQVYWRRVRLTSYDYGSNELFRTRNVYLKYMNHASTTAITSNASERDLL